jgi:hypothetical protein
MAFVKKLGVFRHVVGQPLICERYFEEDEREYAEEFAKNFDMAVLMPFELQTLGFEERQESKNNTFYTPDAIDLGTINLGDKQPEAERQIAQARKQAETDAVEKVALDHSQERGQRTEVRESDNKRAPKVTSTTTTPVSEKNAAASKGSETRTEVDTKKTAKA